MDRVILSRVRFILVIEALYFILRQAASLLHDLDLVDETQDGSAGEDEPRVAFNMFEDNGSRKADNQRPGPVDDCVH